MRARARAGLRRETGERLLWIVIRVGVPVAAAGAVLLYLWSGYREELAAAEELQRLAAERAREAQAAHEELRANVDDLQGRFRGAGQ